VYLLEYVMSNEVTTTQSATPIENTEIIDAGVTVNAVPYKQQHPATCNGAAATARTRGYAPVSRDPAMKGHLLEIHRTLIQYEELVHLLRDEEIGVLMAAQQIHTNTVLVADAVKASKAANKKAASKITLDML
jgi:hypothetical protein